MRSSAAARGASVVVVSHHDVKTRMEARTPGRASTAASATLATSYGPGRGALVRGLPPLADERPSPGIHYANRLQALDDYADGRTLNPCGSRVDGGDGRDAALRRAAPLAMLDLPMPRSLQGLFAGFVPRLAKRPLQTTLIWALFEDLDKRLRTL